MAGLLATLRHAAAALAVSVVALSPVHAADPASDLLAALQIDRLSAVMAAEGIKYGADLQEELFPDSGGPRWDAAVAAIHDAGRMAGIVSARLTDALQDQPEAVAASAAFFATGIGQRAVALEIAAREAMLDEAVKEAAELALDSLKTDDPARVALIDRFIAANDLIESNVAGALNANLAFYRGMIAGGAVDPSLSEQEMMADLWGQEDQVRTDTVDWIYPYLALAYDPLTDAELEAYVAFSATAEGRALNAALFAAFDALFVRLSYDLGLAAAQFLQGQDL